MRDISTIYEVRYFYAGVVALGLNQGAAHDDDVDSLIREQLVHFNAIRNRKYNLPERKASFNQTPRNILSELRQLGLVENAGRGSEKQWSLTAQGWRIFEMLKDPLNSLKLREEFAVLTLITFPIFHNFLNTLNRSPFGMAGIPTLSHHEFDSFTGSPADCIAGVEKAVRLTRDLMDPRFAFEQALYQELHTKLETTLQARVAEGKKVGEVMETEVTRFFIHFFFERFLNNAMRYESVRSRCVFLGLANYFREGRPGRSLEIIYPTARLCSPHTQPYPEVTSHPGEKNWKSEREVSDEGSAYGKGIGGNGEGKWTAPETWHEVSLNEKEPAGGKGTVLLLRTPRWLTFRKLFLKTLQQQYNTIPRAIGYVEVADLRDRVCFELRIPDHIFDDFLKRAIEDGQKGNMPVKVYLDSSLGQSLPLPKRAPLELEQGAFNLVRVQEVDIS